MTKNTVSPETQGKHYEVDVRKIRPLQRAGGNPRLDYGDLEELAADILQNGVTQPLKGFRVSDNDEHDWECVVGHRRLAACMLLVERGNTIRVKILSLGDARKISDEDILLEHITSNSGKQFNPVEMAETIRRLSALGWKTKDISTRLGKSMRLIQNLSLLSTAPKRIRDLIISKTISYTLVLDVFKDSADYNEALEKIELALGSVRPKKVTSEVGAEDAEEPGYEVTAEVHAKVTKRHLNEVTNKVDSFKELQMVLRANIDNSKTPVNPELYSFVKRIVENRFTRQQIENYLF